MSGEASFLRERSPRLTQSPLTDPQKKNFKSEEEFDAEWRAKYGEKGARIIRETVNRNMPDYLYLKQFALKV